MLEERRIFIHFDSFSLDEFQSFCESVPIPCEEGEDGGSLPLSLRFKIRLSLPTQG
jgi:hypothetical protein